MNASKFNYNALQKGIGHNWLWEVVPGSVHQSKFKESNGVTLMYCESCLRKPAVVQVKFANNEVFDVCIDCAEVFDPVIKGGVNNV